MTIPAIVASDADPVGTLLAGLAPDGPLHLLPVGFYVCDPAGVVLGYNRRAAELWGRAPGPGDELSVRFCGAHRLYRSDGLPVAPEVSLMAQALAAGTPLRGDVVIERPDGTRVRTLAVVDILRDAEGAIRGAVSCLTELPVGSPGSDAAAEDEEMLSARRLAAIVESSDDAILAKDLDGIIMSWNTGAEQLFGYRPEEVIGRSVTMLIPAERNEEEPAILARIRRGERIEHYETVRRCKDGSVVDISLSVSPMKDRSGRIIGASTIARDVTEKKRAEERQRLLLREMDHRVKNLFALSSSIVALSARSATTAAELAAAVRERLGALTRAHLLTLPETGDPTGEGRAATTLHTLLRTIVSPYEERADGGPSRVDIRGADVPVAGGAVTSLALLLHEFATNAAKYGALSAPGGRVTIDCTAGGDEVGLTWVEIGGPPVARPGVVEGFGTLLGRATVKGQLGGDIVRDWRPDGLVIRLSVRRDRLAAGAP